MVDDIGTVFHISAHYVRVIAHPATLLAARALADIGERGPGPTLIGMQFYLH